MNQTPGRRTRCSIFFLIPILLSYAMVAAPLHAGEVLVILSNELAPYSDALRGFQATCKSRFKIHNIQGDPDNARRLVGAWSQEKTPVVVAIGTPALESAIKFFPEIPILFTMAYGPPKDVVTSGGLTGVFLDIPLEKYLVLIRNVLPRVHRVGILMNPLYFKENVEDMRVAAKLLDIEIRIKGAGTLREALRSIHELVVESDVVILQPDPLFASDMVFQYALKQSLIYATPLTGTSEHQVKRGALLGLAVDYEQIGHQTATICNQIVKGVRPASLPVVGPGRYTMLFNLKTANALGISIPSGYLEGKEKIF